MCPASVRLKNNKDLFPPALPGFRAINRYWDPKLNMAVAKIQPGEYYIGNQVEGISTVLGSCVAVCIRDPQAGVGGMNHFMLPLDASQGANKMISNATRYGNFAMEHLINGLLKNGGNKNNFEIKLFGGSNVNSSTNNIGLDNVEFAKKYLNLEGYTLSAQDVGGSHPRKIIYNPLDGNILLKRLPITSNKNISESENTYKRSIKKEPVGGEVDLF
jgi:chemotaxis protein CheD